MDYKLFFLSTDLGVVYQDIDGNILEANPAAEKILGYSLNELQRLPSFSPEWYAINEDGTEFPSAEHPTMVSLKTGKVIKDVVMGIKNPKTKQRTWIKINAYPEFGETKDSLIGVFTTFADITQVKIFEENVLIFEKALESSTNAIGMSSADGKHWYQNKAFDELFGHAGEDPPSSLYADESVGRKVFRTIMSGEEWSGEVEMLNKDKKPVNILLRAYPIKHNTSEIAGLVGVHVDITQRKSMEKRLFESEKRYRTIIERAKDAIFLLDANGRILEINDIACKKLGYTKKEFLQLSVKDIDVKAQQDEIFQDFWKTLTPDTQVTIESLHKRKNGSQFPVEINVGLIELSGINYMLGFARDITDRKKSEAAIKNSESRLSNAIKIAKLAYWEYDVKHGQYIFNDQFYSMYKTSVEQIGSYKMSLKEYLNKFVHPDEIKYVTADDWERFRINDPHYSHQIEHRALFGDGSEGYVIARYNEERDKTGDIIKIFGVNQDITDRKLIEKDLIEAKEKAEENDKFKTAFLNNMSHEIRTPLNVIVGYTGLIKEGNLKNDELKSLTEPIFRSSNQLQKIIEDILDISRIETGQLNLSIEKTNINEIVKEVIEEEKLHAANKQLNLSISGVLRKSTTIINTDPSKLKQILVNLVSNAIKYTPKGSVNISVKARKKDLLFIVKDTGNGIDEKHHKIIFERFQRLDSLTSTNYHSTTEGGTGLGLPICKGLVELLGGNIWLDSQAGIGTSFYFTIPRV